MRWFVNPFVHKKGRGALIRRHARLDVFPWRRFEVGRDALIEDYAVVNNGAGDVLIGDAARIGIGSVVIGPVRMGDRAGLGQHVFISGFNHGYADGTRDSNEQKLVRKEVVIGRESHIGANSVVVAGVTIGERCQIGAGSCLLYTSRRPRESRMPGRTRLLHPEKQAGMTTLLNIADWIFIFVLGLPVLYLFVFALFSTRKSMDDYPQAKRRRKFVTLIPAYKSDAVIVRTAQAALRQEYPAQLHEVVVIADRLKPETLAELRTLPIRVLEVSFENSSKAKALNFAVEELGPEAAEAVTILDADNLAGEDFIARLNDVFDSGVQAVQALSLIHI